MSTATMNVAGMNLTEAYSLGVNVTICSIFPIEQKQERKFKTSRNGGFYTAYVIPAAPMDGKTVTRLVIGDATELHQMGRRNSSLESSDAIIHREAPVPGGAVAIAHDILTNTRDAAFRGGPGCQPGIWITEGPQQSDGSRTPTEDEIAVNRAAQKAYFEKLANEADSYWHEGKKNEIGSLHRLAAEYLGLDPRAHEWFRSTVKGDVMPCPMCSVQIDARAIKCAHCGEIVDLERYAAHKQKLAAIEAEGAPKPKPITPPVNSK